MKSEIEKEWEREHGQQLVEIDDEPTAVEYRPADRPDLWKPLPLSHEMMEHVSPCPQCLEVRQKLTELAALMSHASRGSVELRFDARKIHAPGCYVRCGWCHDTGWVIDEALAGLVRNAARLRVTPEVKK